MVTQRHWLARVFPILVALLVACAPAAAPQPAPAVPAAAGAANPAGPATAPAASSGTSAPAAPPLQRASVRLVGLGGLYDSPLIVAKEKGYLEEQGLDIDINVVQSPAEMIPLLATNRVDVGNAGVSSGFYNSVLQGVNVKIVTDGNQIRTPAGVRLVARSSLAEEVRTPADLRGRTVAVPGPAGAGDIWLDRILRAHGLTLADVQTEVVSFPDQLVALTNGKIDASIVAEPFYTFGLLQNAFFSLADVTEHFPEYPIQFLVYSPDFARSQPEVGKRFILAHVKASRFMHEGIVKRINWEELRGIFIRETTIKDAAVWDRMLIADMETNARISTQYMEADQDVYVRLGYLREKVDLRTITDASFGEYARGVLGTYTK